VSQTVLVARAGLALAVALVSISTLVSISAISMSVRTSVLLSISQLALGSAVVVDGKVGSTRCSTGDGDGDAVDAIDDKDVDADDGSSSLSTLLLLLVLLTVLAGSMACLFTLFPNCENQDVRDMKMKVGSLKDYLSMYCLCCSRTCDYEGDGNDEK
jgi:hypothetical protein